MFGRLKFIFGAKANKYLSKAENGPEMLDHAYETMLIDYSKVKEGIVAVVATKHRMIGQRQTMVADIPKLAENANTALTKNRPDLARLYIERKVSLEQRLTSHESQIAVLESDHIKLVTGARQLQFRLQEMRDLRTDLKAKLASATARQQIGQALAGIGTNMGMTQRVIERVRENVELRESEALAIDELLANDTFSDPISLNSNLDRELLALEASDKVDAEMKQLTNQLTKGREVKVS